MKLKHHVKKVKERLDSSERFHKVKRHVKRIYGVWQIITLIILAAALIPIFLQQGLQGSFYSWIVPPSIAVYLIITLIHLKLKPGFVKRYLESTGTRLLLGVAGLGASFLLLAVGATFWAQALLCVSAALYASFLQQVSFLKVIGL